MNSEKTQDKWAQWMLQKRFGGDPEAQETALAFLGRVRDKILENGKLAEGNIVLDVGTGDGLIAFAALDKVGEKGKVIFSDISQDLLDHCRVLAEELKVSERCRFLKAPADNLQDCGDASVDLVTTRSVLIFVKAKQSAFHEFYRVLKPGGRLSIFEPINRFGIDSANLAFRGYDVQRVIGIVEKIDAAYRRYQPASDPMVDFDERDLFSLAEKAGFEEVHLDLHADRAPAAPHKWDTFVHAPPNPLVPSLMEVMRQSLSEEEIKQVTDHLRPQVEAGRGIGKLASSYLWAQKKARAS